MILFGTGVPAQRSLGFGTRVGGEMKWVADRILWGYPGVVPALPLSVVVEGNDRRVGGLVGTLGASIDYLP